MHERLCGYINIIECHSAVIKNCLTPVSTAPAAAVGVSRLHFSEPLLPQNVETDTHASNAIEIPPYPLTGLVSMRRDYGDVMRLIISTGMRLKR